jgi:plastocyanin
MLANAIACLGIAAVTVIVSGCGGDTAKTDEGVVLPSEPISGTTAPAPAAGGAAPPTTASTAPAAATPADTAPAGGAEGWGTIKGRVVFNGTAPEPKALRVDKDPEVCAKTPLKSEQLVVNPDSKGVRNAFVYIARPTKKNPEAVSAASQAAVEFDQKQCTFTPHVIALMKGAKVELKSSDPVNHNVDAHLKVNAKYNNLIPGGKTVEYNPVAAERGPAEVTCDIHSWMKAYWLIIDSPYFAVTDENGNFEIKNVPAGSQKLTVWHEAVAQNFVTAPSGDTINVKAGDTTTLPDFKIDASKVRAE